MGWLPSTAAGPLLPAVGLLATTIPTGYHELIMLRYLGSLLLFGIGLEVLLGGQVKQALFHASVILGIVFLLIVVVITPALVHRFIVRPLTLPKRPPHHYRQATMIKASEAARRDKFRP